MANTDAGFSIPVGFTDREALRQLNRFVSSAEAGFRKAERSAVRSNRAVSQSAVGMSRQSRAAMQNVSYQLQDIFVQISSGQGVSRALSQQLPQLASGFGLVGAAVGLAAAALIPLAGSLLDFESASDSVNSSTDSLREALKAYQEAEKLANLTTQERIEKFGTLAGAMGQVADANLAFAAGDVERALASNQDLLIEKTSDLIELQGTLAQARADAANPEIYTDTQNSIITLTELLDDQLEQLGLTREEGERYAELIRTAASAEGVEAQVNAWKDVGSFIAESVDGTGKLADEHRTVGKALNSNIESMAELNGLTDDTATYAEKYSQTIAAINYSNALAGAQQLRDITAGILSDAVNIMNALGGGGILSGIGEAANNAWNMAQDRIQSIETNGLGDRPKPRPFSVSETAIYGPTTTATRGGRGGSGGSKAQATKESFDYLEALNQEIEALGREQELLGLSSEQIAVQEARWKALDAAKKAGITVTAEMSAKIEEQAAEVGRLTGELERAEIAQQQFDAAIDGIADAMAGALVAGESLRDGLAQVLKGIASDILNSGIRNLLRDQFSIGQGGGGGFFGNLFGGLFGGAPSFAGGGFTGSGSRSGGIDGNGGFPAILHPNETVVDHTRGQGMGSMTFSPSISIAGDASEKTVALIERALENERQQFFGRWTAANKQFGNRIA